MVGQSIGNGGGASSLGSGYRGDWFLKSDGLMYARRDVVLGKVDFMVEQSRLCCCGGYYGDL
jgi:hypothetical protein